MFTWPGYDEAAPPRRDVLADPEAQLGAIQVRRVPQLGPKAMAGAVGFEPTYGGSKVRCLTTWPRPNGFGWPKYRVVAPDLNIERAGASRPVHQRPGQVLTRHRSGDAVPQLVDRLPQQPQGTDYHEADQHEDQAILGIALSTL